MKSLCTWRSNEDRWSPDEFGESRVFGECSRERCANRRRETHLRMFSGYGSNSHIQLLPDIVVGDGGVG